MKEQELYETLESILTTVSNHNKHFNSLNKIVTLLSEKIIKLELEVEKLCQEKNK